MEAEEAVILYKVTFPEYSRHRTKEGHLKNSNRPLGSAWSPEDMVTDHDHCCWWQEDRIQEQFS